MSQILSGSIDSHAGRGSCGILGYLSTNLPDHPIRMVTGGCDREPGAGIPNAVAVHGRHFSSKHHHLEWTTLNMFNGQPQTISYSRVAFACCQHDLIRLYKHLLATGASECHFPDFTGGGCVDIHTLRSIDPENSGQVTIREDLEEASRFYDLLTKSKNRAFPILKQHRSGFSIQWNGFDGQPKRGSEQSQS